METPDRFHPQTASQRRAGRKGARRETSDRWLRCRLDEYQADRLRREAAGTDQTIASLTRSIFEEHWALQDELASPIGRIGDEKRGRIIHQLLAETEERLAASYETELRNVRRDLSAVLKRLDLLSVMVAQAYFVYLCHTPAIPDELRDPAIALAKQRYKRWENSIIEVLAENLFTLPTKVEKSERQQKDAPDPSSNSEHSPG